MSTVSLIEVAASDGPELVQAHIESRDYHHPWVTTFTDPTQFAAWFARIDRDRMMSFVARHRDGRIVGLCTLSEIVRGGFQSAYLGFHGMVASAGQGLMTEAVKLTVKHAFGFTKTEPAVPPITKKATRELSFCLALFPV